MKKIIKEPEPVIPTPEEPTLPSTPAPTSVKDPRGVVQ